jgi:hypothetical protein
MTDMRNEIMDGIAKVIIDKPIDEVAPVLVVTVARVLMIDAGGDTDKVAFLVAKFLHRLADTIHDMCNEEEADAERRKLN